MQKTYQYLGIALAVALSIVFMPRMFASLQGNTHFWYFTIFLLVTATFGVCLNMYQNMKRLRTRGGE